MTPSGPSPAPAPAPTPTNDEAVLRVSAVFYDLLGQQRWHEAIVFMHQSLRELPGEPYFWTLLAVAYRLNEQSVEAIEAIKQSLVLGETPEALFEMLQLALVTGNNEEAMETAAYLKKVYPEWTTQAVSALNDIAPRTALHAKSA